MRLGKYYDFNLFLLIYRKVTYGVTLLLNWKEICVRTFCVHFKCPKNRRSFQTKRVLCFILLDCIDSLLRLNVTANKNNDEMNELNKNLASFSD